MNCHQGLLPNFPSRDITSSQNLPRQRQDCSMFSTIFRSYLRLVIDCEFSIFSFCLCLWSWLFTADNLMFTTASPEFWIRETITIICHHMYPSSSSSYSTTEPITEVEKDELLLHVVTWCFLPVFIQCRLSKMWDAQFWVPSTIFVWVNFLSLLGISYSNKHYNTHNLNPKI